MPKEIGLPKEPSTGDRAKLKLEWQGEGTALLQFEPATALNTKYIGIG